VAWGRALQALATDAMLCAFDQCRALFALQSSCLSPSETELK
jgi:hypothetical protein